MNFRIKHAFLGVSIAIVAVLMVLPTAASAQISIVVSASSTETADAAFLKQVFNGTRSTWPDGSKITVVDQAGSTVGASFYEQFVGVSALEARKTWMRAVLSGQMNAPVKCDSDAEVKRAVTERPGAIGYIATSALDASVKEIHRVR